MQRGRSGSPSSKSTITSWPTRGRVNAPQCRPAETCATRTQHELSAFFCPCRSQWNWTLIRPYLSVKISSPGGPTTTADWVPLTTGLGVCRAGRNGRLAGMAVNVLSYRNPPSSPPPPLRRLAGTWIEWDRAVMTYSPSALIGVTTMSAGGVDSVNLCPLTSCRADPAPRTDTAVAASASIRRFTVRLLSWVTFDSSCGCSPPDLSIPSNRWAYSPGQSYTSSFAESPTRSLWDTLPTVTVSVSGLSASRCWCGSSNVWSQRRNLPAVCSWTFDRS